MPEARVFEAPVSRATVALTGATGFVGRRLQAGLQASGYLVRALVRPDSRNFRQLRPGVQAVPVALDDVSGLARALAPADAVVYCAGSVRGAHFDAFRAANVDGVRAIVNALAGRRTPLLLISSLAASRPDVSDYARSKYEGERVLAGVDLPWAILRPPALYGPGDREMLPILQWLRRGVAPLPGPRDQRLSLLHVDDLVQAVLAWLRASDACCGGCYAIDDGTPGGYDWPGLGAAVAGRPVRLLTVPSPLLNAAAHTNRLLSRLLGYAPMLTPGKVRELRQPDWVGDNRQFSAATGWQPRISLAQGARELFATL